MDITSLSRIQAQAIVGEKVGVAVTKLAMDTATQSAEDLTKMMEQSVTPNLGRNFDQSV